LAAWRRKGVSGKGLQPTLADSERVLGPDHLDILVSRNNLAEQSR